MHFKSVSGGNNTSKVLENTCLFSLIYKDTHARINLSENFQTFSGW